MSERELKRVKSRAYRELQTIIAVMARDITVYLGPYEYLTNPSTT